MVGGSAQRRPVGVSDEVRVAASCPSRRYRSPEAVGILCIKAADLRVREAGPEDGQQTRRIHYILLVVLGEIAEGAGVLLRGVLGPEQSDFGLCGSANGTVDFTKGGSLIVVVHPFRAREL